MSAVRTLARQIGQSCVSVEGDTLGAPELVFNISLADTLIARALPFLFEDYLDRLSDDFDGARLQHVRDEVERRLIGAPRPSGMS